MTDRIDTLLRELEGAPEGSRELDHEILWATTGKRDVTIPEGRLTDGRAPPLYTSSIDAALTLIPDDKLWVIDIEKFAADPEVDVLIFEDVEIEHHGKGWRGSFRGRSKVPALALCIAALKARRGA